MTRSTNPHKPRRARDTAEQALTDLAGVMLNKLFSDPAVVKRYRGMMRRRTPARGLPALKSWTVGGDGRIDVFALAERMRFTVKMVDTAVEADLGVHFDVDADALLEVRIERLAGSSAAARKVARAWIAEADDDPEVSLDELLAALGDSFGAAPTDPEAGPEPATEAETKHIRALAAGAAGRIARDRPALPDPHDYDWLTGNPQTLWPILEQFVAAANASRRNVPLLEALRIFIVAVLDQLRQMQEAGYAWAVRMIDDYRARVAALGPGQGQGQGVPQEDWLHLNKALAQAKIMLTADDRRALAETGADEAAAVTPEQLRGMLSGMLDEMAAAVSSPFEFIESFSETLQVMPPELGAFLAFELVRCPHAVLRESVPLLLLDREAMVRRGAADAMRQSVDAGTVSPAFLRRAIAVRSWLPEVERATVDDAIRAARLKGIEPEQWRADVPVTCLASLIDGGGAQSLILAGTGRGKVMFGGLLLKQGVGIADAWCDAEKPQREVAGLLREVVARIEAVPVSRGYVDIMVQHAIADGLEVGNTPNPILLDIAERIGATDWKPRRLDAAAEALRLFEALPSEARKPQAIEASLGRSAALAREPLAASWFEDNPMVRSILGTTTRLKVSDRVGRLLEEAMPATRVIWLERFVAMALRAANCTDLGEAARGADYAVLAWSLAGDRKVSDIPLMVEIARASVHAYGGR